MMKNLKMGMPGHVTVQTRKNIQNTKISGIRIKTQSEKKRNFDSTKINTLKVGMGGGW